MRRWVWVDPRMIAPAIGRRRIRRGRRWLQNPRGNTTFSDAFLISHGFMPDELVPQSLLRFYWEEATAEFAPLPYEQGGLRAA